MNTLNGYSKSTLSDLFTLTASGGHFPIHEGRNNEKNKLVRTDASGYILAGWINTLSGDMGTTAATRIYCSNDAYIRYKTLANFSSDIARQLYWANVKVSTSSNAATSPTFGNVTIFDGTNSYLYLKTATAGAYAYLAGYNTGGQYGADIVLHSGSSMVLGAGESAAAMYSNNVDSLRGSENLYLTADRSIKIFTNCDSIANRKYVACFDTTGYTYFNSYINIGGHEKNASSPTYVWGSNASDNFLRSYQTNKLSVSYASSSGSAAELSLLSKNLSSSPGTWVSSGGSIIVSGNDYVVFLASAGYDTFLLTADANTLYFRQNDSTNIPSNGWKSWVACINSENWPSFINYSTLGSLPSHSHSYLPLSGGTMTGNISYAGSLNTYTMIKFINNTSDPYGNGISIGGGGLTIIGGGESADVIASQYSTGGTEDMCIGNDGNIYLYANLLNGWDYRKTATLDTSGNFTVSGSFYASSDIRYKLIQTHLLNKVNSIAELPIFTYYWKDNLHDDKLHIGSSAQAVKEVFPELVTYDKSKDFYNLDYATLGTIAGITACKELVTLKSEIELLKDRIELLEQQLKMYHGNNK